MSVRTGPTILGRIGLFAFPLIARYRRVRLLRWAAAACTKYLDCYASAGCDIERNGERRVLERLQTAELHHVFDVGANTGGWANTARDACSNATIHCFEVVPSTAEILGRRFAGDANIQVNTVGLGDCASDVEVLYYPADTELSAVAGYTPFPWSDFGKIPVRQCGRVVTGDSYVQAHHLEQVDFLKIDTEGAELRVLQGLTETISAGLVPVIQFEYGAAAIYSHVLLRDLYAWLEEHGYIVGKIYPTFVDFRPYTISDEDFRGPNYIAVLSNRPDLIEALR